MIDGDTLYETTQRCDRCFGVVLPPLWALKFWFENVFVHDYPGGDAPPEFWESQPGIFALVDELGPLSPAECFRRTVAWWCGVATDIVLAGARSA